MDETYPLRQCPEKVGFEDINFLHFSNYEDGKLGEEKRGEVVTRVCLVWFVREGWGVEWGKRKRGGWRLAAGGG